MRPHKGTDFAAPVGTPILATADGIVSKSEKKGGNGNYVKIKHPWNPELVNTTHTILLTEIDDDGMVRFEFT